MPLYMLVRPSGKGGGKASKTPKGLQDYMHKRAKRTSPQATAQNPSPCYVTEAPQEFDEKGKELGPDAQVWKTYVREADQVDEELVDGWNKSMDVILIFAALFSAISTAFVIESYKNLKQDPTDVSSQTLLTISQTLMLIANGSQPAITGSTSETETPAFQASAKAICVNVLWFLSLSLSVAVSLISMLAKEWCLEFMAGRTGPPGAQVRRRQQRWDGLVKWRMKELIMMLPSLIHVSLLLFAIGLCVFLWDVHYGVAIPVVIVTTFAAGAYFACAIVPFLYDYCPYGTVLSRLAKQFITIGSQPARDNVVQDQVTANALNWMIVNCETPRSVDIALQSLAAADENLPTQVLEKCHAWAMIKQRLESGDVAEQTEQHRQADERYARALEVYPLTRGRIDGVPYHILGREGQIILGIQATIQSLIDETLLRSRTDPNLKNITTIQVLHRCSAIGPHYLSHVLSRTYGLMDARDRYAVPVEPEVLVEDLVTWLEQYLKNGASSDSHLYDTLSASLSFLLCCNAMQPLAEQFVDIKYILRLIRSYSPIHATSLLRCALWLLIHSERSDEPWSNYSRLELFEYLWSTLMATARLDSFAPQRLDSTYLAHGMLFLLTNPHRYALSSEDCENIRHILHWSLSSNKIQSIYHAHYIRRLSQDVSTMPDKVAFAPQVIRVMHCLLDYSPWEDCYVLPTSEIYILVVKDLCVTVENILTNGWSAYDVLLYSPIPKCSPQLVQQLSSSDLITHLSNAIESEDYAIQMFATAQLWLFLSMSIYEADRKSPTLSVLEQELLKYPGLENNLERQEAVAEGLESKLMVLPSDVYYGVKVYLYRVMEVMLQRRSTPLPHFHHSGLMNVPTHLRGMESSVNYETERLVAYPDLMFDSEGWPSAVPTPDE